jgi:hypothetical protein
LKTVFNNGRSAGNIVKNWREITLKNCRLLITADLKTHYKIISKHVFPTLYCDVLAYEPCSLVSCYNLPNYMVS